MHSVIKLEKNICASNPEKGQKLAEKDINEME